jgi:hypothetical protein
MGHLTLSDFDRYDIVTETDLETPLGKLDPAAAGKEKGENTKTGRSEDPQQRL